MPPSDSIESEIISIVLGSLPLPPVDLEEVARYAGVFQVVRTECRAGFTTFNRPGPTVHISRSASRTRSRFIFAHELAHVMLRLPCVTQLVQDRGYVALLLDEEQLADRIAATLLIPDRWVETMRKSRMTLADILHLTRQADVAPEMLVRRMATSQIDIGMLRWRQARRRWAVVDRPGVPPDLHGCVRPTFAGHWSLENMEGEESDLAIDCYVNDGLVTIVGTGARSGRDVLQLIQPSRSVLAASNTATQRFREQIVAALDSSSRDDNRFRIVLGMTHSPVGYHAGDW
jgi:IrrE N-terminal-like domain